MSYKQLLPFLLLAFMGCKKDDPTSQTSPCQYPYGTLSRKEFIQGVPAIVVLRGQKNGEFSFQIVPSDGNDFNKSARTPWGSCNLGTAFQKDSLKVSVSGYFLTSGLLETMNVSPLPFEVTSMQVRN